MQVKEFAILCEHLESVGKPFGNDHHMCVLRGQLFGMPIQECRRSCSKVNCDIPYLTLDAANQLHFGMRSMLKMQPTYRTDVSRTGLIDLYDLSRANDFAEFVLAVQPGEVPALIGLER